LGVEDLDEPDKISEGAGQPVDFVEDHDIDPAAADVGQQTLQRWELHIAAREPAIVVMGPRHNPALMALAADVGLAGFTLCGERVEFLLQPFLGGLPGVDGAAPQIPPAGLARARCGQGCPPVFSSIHAVFLPCVAASPVIGYKLYKVLK
jgi:hypothetical protein